MFLFNKKILLLFFLTQFAFLGFAQEEREASDDAGYVFLPVLMNYNGIGLFYGGVAGYRSENYGQLLLGGVGGDVTGAGGLYALKFQNNHELRVSAGSAKLAPLTYFGRSSDRDDPFAENAYRQVSNLQAYGLAYKATFAHWIFRASASQAESRVNEFQNENREIVPSPNLNVIPFRQTTFNLGASYRTDFGSDNFFGTRVDFDYSDKSSSSGYAASAFATVKNSWNLSPINNLSLFLNYRHSAVVSFSDPGLSLQAISELFAIDCTQADSDKRGDCFVLLNSLFNYLTGHNNHGTAASLGGSQYLKAYAEGRFRGAQTSYLGFDAKYRLSDKIYIPELYLSLETGSARDEGGGLFLFDRSSAGAGLNWALNELNVLLFAGSGDDGNMVSLTLQL